MRSEILSLSRTLVLAGGMLILGSGCQHPPDALSETPAYPIVIPVFSNETFEPALEAKLTRLIKQEFLRRKGFRVIRDPGQADLILKGKITSFGLQPLSFDAGHRTAEYRVTILARIQLMDGRENTPLWEQSDLEGTAEFFVDPDPGVSRSAQDLATEEAAKRLAETTWMEVFRLAHSGLPRRPNTDGPQPVGPEAGADRPASAGQSGGSP